MDKVTQLLCKNRWCVCVCERESVRERESKHLQTETQIVYTYNMYTIATEDHTSLHWCVRSQCVWKP